MTFDPTLETVSEKKIISVPAIRPFHADMGGAPSIINVPAGSPIISGLQELPDLSDISMDSWLSARYADDVSLDIGIETVYDLSGNSRNASQATDSLQPSWGSPGITHNGAADKYLAAATGHTQWTNTWHFFVVVSSSRVRSNNPTESGTGTAYYSDDANNNTVFVGAQPSGVCPILSYHSNHFALCETKSGLAPFNISRSHSVGSGIACVEIKRVGTTSIQSSINFEGYVDGSYSSENMHWTVINFCKLYWHSSSSFQGTIYETILVTGELTDDERGKIQTYLNNRWGIISPRNFAITDKDNTQYPVEIIDWRNGTKDPTNLYTFEENVITPQEWIDQFNVEDGSALNSDWYTWTDGDPENNTFVGVVGRKYYFYLAWDYITETYYRSKYRFEGDFEIEWIWWKHYSGNATAIAWFRLRNEALDWYLDAGYRYASGHGVYVQGTNVAYNKPYNSEHVRVKVIRSGANISYWYYNSSWIQIGTTDTSAPTGPLILDLGLYSTQNATLNMSLYDWKWNVEPDSIYIPTDTTVVDQIGEVNGTISNMTPMLTGSNGWPYLEGQSNQTTISNLSFDSDIPFQAASFWAKRAFTGVQQEWGLRTNGNDAFVANNAYASFVDTTSGWTLRNSNLTWNDTSWHHFVIVRVGDTSNYLIYMDRVAANSALQCNFGGVIRNWGRSAVYAEQTLSMANLRVFDYTLLESEIDDLFNTTDPRYAGFAKLAIPFNAKSEADEQVKIVWDATQSANVRHPALTFDAADGSLPDPDYWVTSLTGSPTTAVYEIADNTYHQKIVHGSTGVYYVTSRWDGDQVAQGNRFEVSVEYSGLSLGNGDCFIEFQMYGNSHNGQIRIYNNRYSFDTDEASSSDSNVTHAGWGKIWLQFDKANNNMYAWYRNGTGSKTAIGGAKHVDVGAIADMNMHLRCLSQNSGSAEIYWNNFNCTMGSIDSTGALKGFVSESGARYFDEELKQETIFYHTTTWVQYSDTTTRTYRIVMNNIINYATGDGYDYLKIRFKGHASGGYINKCYIGERDSGDAWDFNGNQVQVFFNGGDEFVDIGSSDVYSDPIYYQRDGNKNLIISMLTDDCDVIYQSNAQPSNCDNYLALSDVVADDAPTMSSDANWMFVNGVYAYTDLPKSYPDKFRAIYYLATDPSDGTDSIIDSTGNGYNGTPAGTMLTEDLVRDVDGNIGIATDGTDDKIALSSNLGITAFPFTIISRFKVDDLTTVQPIFSGDIASNYAGVTVQVATTGEIEVRLGDGAGVTSADYLLYETATGEIVADTIYVVCVRAFAFDNVEVWIDKIEKALTTSGTGTSADLTNASYVIASSVADSTFFKGTQYFLGVADEALDFQEILYYSDMIAGDGFDFELPVKYADDPLAIDYTIPAAGEELTDFPASITLHPSAGKESTDTSTVTGLLDYNTDLSINPPHHAWMCEAINTKDRRATGADAIDLTATNMTPKKGGPFGTYLEGGDIDSTIRSLDFKNPYRMSVCSFWFRRRDLSNYCYIWYYGSYYLRVEYSGSTQPNRMMAWDSDTDWSGHYVTDTNWHHLLMVHYWYASTVYLYLDGVADSNWVPLGHNAYMDGLGKGTTADANSEVPDVTNIQIWPYATAGGNQITYPTSADIAALASEDESNWSDHLKIYDKNMSQLYVDREIYSPGGQTFRGFVKQTIDADVDTPLKIVTDPEGVSDADVELDPSHAKLNMTGADGDSLDPRDWIVQDNTTAGSALIYGNKLRLTVPVNANEEALYAYTQLRHFKISGDFDIVFPYDITFYDAPSSGLSYPARIAIVFENGGYVGLSTQNNTGFRYQGTLSGNTGITSNYFATGFFRFTRVGSVIKGYYWDSTAGQWEWDDSTAGHTFTETYTDDLLYLTFSSAGDFDGGETVEYGNMQVISADSIVGRGLIGGPESTVPKKVWRTADSIVSHFNQHPVAHDNDLLINNSIYGNFLTLPQSGMVDTGLDFTDYGHSIEFDNTNDHVEHTYSGVPSQFLLDTQTFSVLLVTSKNATGSEAGAFAYGGALTVTSATGWTLEFNGSNCYFIVSNGTTETVVNSSIDIGDMTIWHAVYDGTNQYLYKNGILVDSNLATGITMQYLQNFVTIGARSGGDKPFNGDIEEARFSTIAHSEKWASYVAKGFLDTLATVRFADYVEPPPPPAYNKPTDMLIGFGVPLKVDYMMVNGRLVNSAMLPLYPTFSGDNKNG